MQGRRSCFARTRITLISCVCESEIERWEREGERESACAQARETRERARERIPLASDYAMHGSGIMVHDLEFRVWGFEFRFWE